MPVEEMPVEELLRCRFPVEELQRCRFPAEGLLRCRFPVEKLLCHCPVGMLRCHYPVVEQVAGHVFHSSSNCKARKKRCSHHFVQPLEIGPGNKVPNIEADRLESLQNQSRTT